MGIHAYNELYLPGAQNILGHAVDFAVMTLEIEPKIFDSALRVSKAVKQFAQGNPRYVAGMNGCELAREILDEVQLQYPDVPDAMYLDKSPEYWAGWALAYYQWLTDRPFKDILRAASLEQIIGMYPVYHEMDIEKFAEQMNCLMKKAFPYTRLREHRDNCGMSQAELAAEAGVPLRQIQLFEQGHRDINKTAAVTLYKLAKAMCCRMEDLLEPEYENFC